MRSLPAGTIEILHKFRDGRANAKCFNFRTGKFVGHKVPGASLAVMMIDGIVPKSLRNWFGVVKTAVIDRSDDCEEDYMCSLLDDEDNGEETA